MKNKYTKIILFGTIILALAGTSYLLAAKKYDLWPFAKVAPQSQTTTNAPVPTGSTVDKSADDSKYNGSDPSPEPTPSSDGGKSSVGLILSSANRNDPNLQVRAIIQTITSSGTCTLTLKNQATGVIKTYTAEVQAMASASTCKGFDVPLTDLSSGEWKLTLKFENDSLQGEVTKDITI